MLSPIEEEVVVVKEGYKYLTELFEESIYDSGTLSEDEKDSVNDIFEMGLDSVDRIEDFVREKVGSKDEESVNLDSDYIGTEIAERDRVNRLFSSFEHNEDGEELQKLGAKADSFWIFENYYDYCAYGDREYPIFAKRFVSKSRQFLIERVLRLERMCAFHSKNLWELRAYVDKKRGQVSGEWERVSFEGIGRTKEAEERKNEIRELRAQSRELGSDASEEVKIPSYDENVRKLEAKLDEKDIELSECIKEINKVRESAQFFKIALGTLFAMAIFANYFAN